MSTHGFGDAFEAIMKTEKDGHMSNGRMRRLVVSEPLPGAGPIRSLEDLRVYQLSYALAMEVFEVTKHFPREELYSITDQIRRSSRSVTANIVEGWAKRRYENVFERYLIDSLGSCSETKLSLKFALDCKYLRESDFSNLVTRYDEVGRMLHGLIENWRTFR